MYEKLLKERESSYILPNTTTKKLSEVNKIRTRSDNTFLKVFWNLQGAVE